MNGDRIALKMPGQVMAHRLPIIVTLLAAHGASNEPALEPAAGMFRHAAKTAIYMAFQIT